MNKAGICRKMLHMQMSHLIKSTITDCVELSSELCLLCLFSISFMQLCKCVTTLTIRGSSQNLVELYFAGRLLTAWLSRVVVLQTQLVSLTAAFSLPAELYIQYFLKCQAHSKFKNNPSHKKTKQIYHRLNALVNAFIYE